MSQFRTTDAEQKIHKAVKMFIELVLDSKDELKVDGIQFGIDFACMRSESNGNIFIAFIIKKGDKEFGYTHTLSASEINILRPEILARAMKYRAKSAIEKIKEQLIKNVK